MVGHINLKDDNSSVLCLLLVSLCLSIGRNHMGDRGDMSPPAWEQYDLSPPKYNFENLTIQFQ